ncbi:MAG: dockerin type I domain-containing protein [Ruminococcus flavefaciens]|nr:dockerin type I domain-containing protein [Ruminococcus flavefaciens]MCM1229564.1 dockerin type I domain-containing protein [Ruminococcus flavefaciens]
MIITTDMTLKIYIKKLFAGLLAGLVTFSAVPFNSSAVDTHNVVIIDFNGSVMQTLTVPHGSVLDLSGVDTSSLDQHPDIYTQVAFNTWGNLPEGNIVNEDIAVYALFRKMIISCNKYPKKIVYYSDKGDIKLDGLDITITDYVQIPEKDSNGAFIVREEVTNIESKCTTVPASLDEAFADGKQHAVIDVYPINSEIPIISYGIDYFKGLGDVNNNSQVEASDASSILYYYSAMSTSNPVSFSDNQKLRADIDGNGTIDATDASKVLSYYTMLSTTGEYISWDDFLGI